MVNPQLDVAFTRAIKYESRIKLALESESGAGKTLTALILASRIAKHRGGRVALADSEHKSALLYADLIDFDHFAMPDHRIETYLAVMNAAERMKYSVLIMDSTSHVWNGKNGALQEVDAVAEHNRTARGSKNSFGAWSTVRPKLNELVDRINEIDIDLICTFRQKRRMAQVQQADGTTKVENLGMEMIGPGDIEYEFTILCDLLKDSNDLIVNKTRCPRIKGKVYHALSTVEPIDLDKEPPTATHGMVDEVIEWLKGNPLPKQEKAVVGATKAYVELHDRFRRAGVEDLWEDLMDKYGLAWHYAGRQMDEPSIMERGREVFKVLKSLVAAKELEQKLAQTDAPTTQQTDTPTPQPAPQAPSAASSPTDAPKQDPQPVTVSPAQPAVPQPQQDPTPGPVPQQNLTINDFQKNEIDTLFKTLKAQRPKGYNRAAFLDELQTYRGTREDFLAAVMTIADNNAGGQA